MTIVTKGTVHDLAARLAQVDQRTQELIAQGFSHAGKVFSLSLPAQNYWADIVNLPAENFPVEVNTLDDTSTHFVLDLAEAGVMKGAAMAAVLTALASGTAVKNQLRAATTPAELDAIEDTR